MIRVGDKHLKIDVESWMKEVGLTPITKYDKTWVSALCPFHNERRPSFAVNRDTGCYHCLACKAKGTFAQLVAKVENHDNVIDAEYSLIMRYGVMDSLDAGITLSFESREALESMKKIPERSFPFSSYLEKRGIDKATQERFQVGQSTFPKTVDLAVAIPWQDHQGNWVTVKYRGVSQKTFVYDPPIKQLSSLLWGYYRVMNVVNIFDFVFVVEGEIDALSFWRCGFPAVALGGTVVTQSRTNRLIELPVNKVCLALDNPAVDTIIREEKVGEKAHKQLAKSIAPYKHLQTVDWSDFPDCKDPNDVLVKHGFDGMLKLIHNVKDDTSWLAW